jgi:hypothetical protein
MIFAAVPRHEGTEFNSDRWLGVEAGHDEPEIEPMMPLESARSQLMVRITACPVVPTHKGTAEVSGDFCVIPCGSVWAAYTLDAFPHTRHGSVLIHARYLRLRVGFIGIPVLPGCADRAARPCLR